MFTAASIVHHRAGSRLYGIIARAETSAADLDGGAANAAQTWASGYLGSSQAWAYAKDAFDKWSAPARQGVRA
jgi:hypothetical protein